MKKMLKAVVMVMVMVGVNKVKMASCFTDDPIRYPLPPYASLKDSSDTQNDDPIRYPLPPLPPYASLKDSSDTQNDDPIRYPLPPLPPKV